MLKKLLVLAVTAVAIFGAVIAAGSQGGGSGVYTAQQADAGRASYQANCSACHLPDLGGQGDAAPLRGAEFMGAWGARTTKELLSFMQLTMPPARPGSLPQQEYLDIVAFILQQNGAAAGNQAFAANTEMAIRSAATGQAPAAAQAGGGGGQRGAAGQRGGAPPVARGITIAGEVRNFTRVTDAMLRNPDPADWLMIRRDYHASNYSPLNQINRDNVRDLRLQWVWA
ncbi:MAG: c-type cytochrome, partial [Acidobacteria bacterium]|nr:c-type cytochrome [Acidobacteriota bacterium]